MPETWLWSLTQEYPKCHRVMKPVWQNYWAYALQPGSHDSWNPCTLKPMPHNERSPCSQLEKNLHGNEAPAKPTTSTDTSFSFLMCKMRIVSVPTSLWFWGVNKWVVKARKALRTFLGIIQVPWKCWFLLFKISSYDTVVFPLRGDLEFSFC